MKKKQTTLLAALLCLVVITGESFAATLQVGADKPYKQPSLAINDAQDGDIIEIDTDGDYTEDVARITANNLILRGVGEGRATLDSKGKVADGKGIWHITGNDITVENIEFIGAR